ncbi:hypothetical protein HMPREF3091_18225 [Hafnia sp. HMSC23F03]|nr:hypothetical protein HMPREF3091_18225 [Hafnia sp. HMSC23F03]
MNRRTVTYCAVVILSILFGYSMNWISRSWPLSHEEYFIYGITSKDSIVNVPPTIWLPSEDLSISLQSITLSKYLLGSAINVHITIIKGVRTKNGEIKPCGSKLFDLHDAPDVEMILDAVIHKKWENCNLR